MGARRLIHEFSRSELSEIGAHQLNSSGSKGLSIQPATIVGQAENHAREPVAGCLYRFETRTNSRCDLLPGIIKSLPEDFEACRPVAGTCDQRSRFHDRPPVVPLMAILST